MIRINLAPTQTRHRRVVPGFGFAFKLPAFNLGVLFGLVYALVVGAIGVYWLGQYAYETRLAGQIERATRENEQLKATLGAGANIQPQLIEARKRVQVIEQLMKDQGRPIALLDAFVDTLPTDLWITGLEERSDVLKLRGTAYSTTAVADFMSNLKKSGRFKEIEITVARQDLAKAPSLVMFEVTCRFEG